MRLGRYEVEGELGRGAMGVVYKAVDPTIGRRLAIKTLLVGGAAVDADLRERFSREAKAAGVLQHPNIVTIHDVGQDDDGNPFIAMEFLDGANLAAVLRAGALGIDQALGILMQVADALDYAHAKGIVHRDVKPANIVLTPSSVVKITDFGIAKLESAEALTQVGHFVGTPNYIAPEQLAGQPVDGRADLFSLAVMAYEMLSGRRPFTGDNFTTLSYKIMNAPPPVLEALPPKAMAVLSRGLAKRPEDRYASGVEFVDDLASSMSVALTNRSPSGRIPATRPPRPPAPTLGAPTRKASEASTSSRPLFPLLAGGAVAVVLAAILVAGLLYSTIVFDGNGKPATPRTTPAPSTSPTATGTPRPTASRPATPRPTGRPTTRPTVRPPTARPSRPTATPAPEGAGSARVKINLQVFEAPRGGSATLLVDGRGVQTYQFSSFPGDDRGYVKKDVTLPPGSHDAQLRVEINGSPKVIESSRMRVELEARDEVELHAEVRAGAFTLARFEPVERSP